MGNDISIFCKRRTLHDAQIAYQPHVDGDPQKLIDDLVRACSDGRIDRIKELVSAGANVNGHMKDGETPLLAACGAGHARAITELLAAGAAVNLPSARFNGHTPLIAAIAGGHVAVYGLLYECGASVPEQWTEFVAGKIGYENVVALQEQSAALQTQFLNLNPRAWTKRHVSLVWTAQCGLLEYSHVFRGIDDRALLRLTREDLIDRVRLHALQTSYSKKSILLRKYSCASLLHESIDSAANNAGIYVHGWGEKRKEKEVG